MKILYVLNGTFLHGGTESVILNYYNNIDRSKIKIDFVLNAPKSELEKNDTCKYLISKGSKVFCITPRRDSTKRNKAEFLEILKKEKYDAVHSHADAVGTYFLLLAKKAGVKIRIAHSHNTKHQLIRKGIKNQIHFAYLEINRKKIRKIATHYMACSREAGEWLFGKDNIKNNRVYILNNAIDINKYKFNDDTRKTVRKKLDIADNTLVVGHVGRFEFQKNHVFLLKIFASIQKRCPDSKLLLVGEGHLKDNIFNQSKELGILDDIIFYGTNRDISEVYNAMDVFIFPSLFEGLGMVLIEAQCNGLKCFMTDNAYVSKDPIITQNVKRMPIDNSEDWANEILKADLERVVETDSIRCNGYDIKLEAVKLEKYYLSL